MAVIYRTKQGDMIDLICFRHYGRSSGAVEVVLEANRDLSQQPAVLPLGIEITLPDISPIPTPQPVRLWD
ncbi:tail protein X [Aestuariivirga sp. YIM B02566]|uniref:Tail protein X n=1 Tax=Taklimakanibacter albus TaxID=2800327 RepID=A0ACC5R6J7_9HYPH|nr:tail protein X [Aestuariivirga sp. YIM B02566]MBK1868243.1 tail protein X [Aestuariivirga sp. YIM B02566]